MSVINFIDPSAQLGPGVKVWHFAVIMPNVWLGTDVSVGSRAEIGKDSVIEHHSRISSGVFLPPNSYVGRRVFIGPNTTFTDDRYPKAGNSGYKAERPYIEDDVSIGAGCVILPGVRIGARSLIGAGSIVTQDVPPDHILRGLPSRELYLRPAE